LAEEKSGDAPRVTAKIALALIALSWFAIAQAATVPGDKPTSAWFVTRSAQFAAAHEQWQQQHRVPAPAELGIP
jgi:hypothetical protein